MIGRTNAGGGGTGATLTVSAPAGVSVIATNSTTNRTYTRTANSSGVAVFRGLPTGTYSVHITDGTTTSDNFTANVVADYSLTVKFFAAYINVTYPSGSTCTCTDGVTTFTATDTSGSYQFVVPNTGTWTVSCTDGVESTSALVTITTDKQVESAALSYYAATLAVTWPSGSTCTCTLGAVTLTAPDTSGSYTFALDTPGTWTVTCKNAYLSKSTAVAATTSGAYSVQLSYLTYLVQDGVSSIGLPQNCFPSAFSESNYISLSNTYVSAGKYSISDFQQTTISTRGYNTIYFGASVDSGVIKLQLVTDGSESVIAEIVVTNTGHAGIDISTFNGDYFIRLRYMRNNGYAWYHLHSIWLE